MIAKTRHTYREIDRPRRCPPRGLLVVVVVILMVVIRIIIAVILIV